MAKKSSNAGLGALLAVGAGTAAYFLFFRDADAAEPSSGDIPTPPSGGGGTTPSSGGGGTTPSSGGTTPSPGSVKKVEAPAYKENPMEKDLARIVFDDWMNAVALADGDPEQARQVEKLRKDHIRDDLADIAWGAAYGPAYVTSVGAGFGGKVPPKENRVGKSWDPYLDAWVRIDRYLKQWADVEEANGKLTGL